MPVSRLSRIEDQKQKKRLMAAILGTIALIAFVALFGVNALIGFSLFVDKIRGNSPQNTQSNALILPPVLDPPVAATNSAQIVVTGKGQAGLSLIAYVNGDEIDSEKIPDTGTFSIDVKLKEGTNTVSAKITDDKENTSELSNVVSVVYVNKPPELTVSDPSDNATINGEKNTVTVNGITGENTTVTVNDRFVVVHNDNTFSYDYPLNEGDNILKIVATDSAGNRTTVERRVTYHK